MKNVRACSRLWLALLAACGLLIASDDARGQQRLAPSVIQLAPEPKPSSALPSSAAQPMPEINPAPAMMPDPDARAVVYPHCHWQPLYQCLVAPYDCKPRPCGPFCGYDKSCDKYCGKPLPCPPAPCAAWCPGCYVRKPPVSCFPGNPCPPCGTSHHGR